MKEDGKDQTWKDKTGRKYQSYGAEQRLERAQLEKGEDDREELKDKKKQATSSLSEESEVSQSSTNIQEPGSGAAENDDGEEVEEEVEFDLEAQIEEFRQQIEEEPENCVHHYNLGEALAELEQTDAAKAEFERALELDEDKAFSAIIHFGLGGLYYHEMIAGIQGNIVRSSVGLHS
ncbi:MAG: hypothetical protein HOG74_06260, partial [Nitrospina sp.]|nr:hypothetical protein [Nitrospina sp.]